MRYALKSTLIFITMLQGVSYATRGHAADLGTSRGYSSSYSSSSTPIMASNWAGFYAGLHLGYGFGHSRSAELDGFIGGAHVGFNLQSNQVVFGLEGDLNYSGLDYRGFTETFRDKWGGSGRIRVGYAMDRFMPFVTGGLAFSNGTMKSGGAKDSHTHIGYVLGVGAEMMVTSNVSASLQYLHTRYGSQTYIVTPNRNANLVTNEVRLGLSYRF